MPMLGALELRATMDDQSDSVIRLLSLRQPIIY